VPPSGQPTGSPSYTFDDEFSGPAGANPNYGLSATYWYLDDCWRTGCGNRSPTQYSQSNAYLDGQGDLVLEADRGSSASCGFGPCQYTSAGLTMVNWQSDGMASWSQTYGTFSARIKLPVGQGLWPAFWMTGSNEATVKWPLDGEIDVLELRGQQPTVIQQHLEGGSVLLRTGAGWTMPAGQSAAGWHIYSVTWNPAGIEWKVDGIATLLVTPAEARNAWPESFEHPFSMRLDLTVGGDLPRLGEPNSSTVLPAKMLVDWIRVTSS